jgi:hypothetical protein
MANVNASLLMLLGKQLVFIFRTIVNIVWQYTKLFDVTADGTA